MRRLRPALAALAAAAALASPATAIDKGITAPPVDNRGGSIMPALAALRADFLLHTVSWADTAPTPPADPRDPADPAYRWEELDRVMAEAASAGIEIVPQVMWTPAWANGGRPPSTGPADPQAYADFLTALGTRHPQIRRWLIWGEPVRGVNWRPQSPAGAQAYARLLDAAYGAVKALDPADQVIGGNSYCCGLDTGNSTSAREWLKQVRLPDGRPPRLDLYGFNPYTERQIDMRQTPRSYRGMDFNDLDTLARLIDRVYPRRRLGIFVGEFGFQTEGANYQYPYTMPRDEQARRLLRSFRDARRLGRVVAISNYLLYDQPPRTVRGQPAAWSTGLLTYDGRPKPAWYVFRRWR